MGNPIEKWIQEWIELLYCILLLLMMHSMDEIFHVTININIKNVYEHFAIIYYMQYC
jgi:hypothetical protein